MQEKLKMIADHEEKHGQIGDEVRGLLLQQKHHIIQKKLDEWGGWSEVGGKVVF
ncbi:TPA: hypothetical protein U1Z56_000132 [Streptococcus suis]|nr:hypothetical protein [Streptococcus suis]MDW8733079.1 hypothetical protein [Streptococcus suis]NQM10997.1 hypothetical protein [Streptococcus suis]NQM44205.1 hypothetical protein [Streptococcus suis]HEM4083031.1 hypothetical protein [Streptococcus suis]